MPRQNDTRTKSYDDIRRQRERIREELSRRRDIPWARYQSRLTRADAAAERYQRNIMNETERRENGRAGARYMTREEQNVQMPRRIYMGLNGG